MIKTCAVVLLLVLVGPHSSEAEEPTFLGFKNSQQCMCECECPTPGDSKCMCDCECPRPGSSCGPGFTQVCPSPDGTCPENFMPLCPEDLTAAGRADTPMVQNREEEVVTVDVDAFTCSKKSIACSIVVTFAEDCSSITSAKPTCSQKKAKCNAKVISFAAGGTFATQRCIITGTYKNTGKKQSMSKLSIAVNPDYTTTTTTTTTTAPPAGAGGDYNCQCVPDFMLYMGQLAMGGASARQSFMGSCVCVAGMMDIGS